MSANETTAPEDDVDELPSLQEMYAEMQELRETVEDQRDRIEDLEAENRDLRDTLSKMPDVEFQGPASDPKNLWIGTHPFGRIVKANQNRSESNEDGLESLESGTPNTSVSAAARDEMLPAHRMWADVRSDGADDLGKSNRRAAVLFGAIVRKAGNGDATDDKLLPYNGVDASGQNYTFSSTEAKRTLEESQIVDGKMYSATVKRAFENMQRLTKEESCECSNIETCQHGLAIFDASGGTNRLAANKARFHDAMHKVEASVTEAVDGDESASQADEAPETADDSVSPEHGPDEDAVDETMDELNQLTNAVEADDD